MKQFTRFSIGRGLAKPITLILLVGFITAFAGTAVETYRAKTSAGTEQVYHQNLADRFSIIGLVCMVLPATIFYQSSSVLGFRKAYFSDNPSDRPLSRSDKALWDYLVATDPKGLSKSRQNTRDLLMKGDLKIETYAESLLFTLPISQGGRRTLLDASTSYFEGRIPQEWDRGALPEGFLLALSHIGIGYATDAAITVPEGDVDFVTQPNSWPAALRNAKVMFSQNGNLVQQFRAKFAGTQAASTEAAVEGDGLEFQKPFILEDVKSNLIELYHPSAVNMPATPAYLFLEIKMFGSCVRPFK